jgi:putative membrane protein
METFEFGMEYAGPLHMVLGAAAMFAFGVAVIGFRRTAIFFAVSTILSAGSEVIGTSTGWPFGNYEYLDSLGFKLFDRVPFTIPLSWFYMGFAGYLLGRAIVANRGLRPVEPWAIGLGVWFLIVWDLVLDPAMAHQDLRIQFWVWHQEGPYFGMPIQNYLGWAATAVLFMAVSRILWRRGVDPASLPSWFPFAVYAANSGFAMAISADVGLYVPIVLSAVFGVAPALLALPPRPSGPAETEHDAGGRVLRPSPSR